MVGTHIILYVDQIGGVMVNVLGSNALDRGFDPRSGVTKDYKKSLMIL